MFGEVEEVGCVEEREGVGLVEVVDGFGVTGSAKVSLDQTVVPEQENDNKGVCSRSPAGFYKVE